MRCLRVGTIVLVALFGLQACNDLRPLYGTNGLEQESSVVTELSNIQIPEPKNRLQQLIRNNLISTMSPPGQEGDGRYTLVLVPQSDEFDLVIERNTDVSRRSYRLKVDFSLRDGSSGRKIYSGSTFSEVSYDKITSEFANLQAKTNAEERASRQVSQDIRTRLAAYFATRSPSS